MEYGPLNAHKHNLQKELVCIEYPGLVHNPDRLLASFGGQLELSTAIGSEKRRLELRFRPESCYAKPAFGDRHATSGLVLKIKTRRRRSQPSEVQVRSIEIAGRVSLMYKFESMCDFQLLPAFRNQAGTVECAYEQLVPKGIITTIPKETPANVPYFLPPISFSRFDTAQTSIFKAKDIVTDVVGIGDKDRASRTKHGLYMSFSLTDPLPTEPNPLAVRTIEQKRIPQETIDLISNSFMERPVWTKSALKGTFQLSEDDVRYILPVMGIYFVNGPWRGTWVRFGYDPRKHFESRFYQLLDFRVRAIGALHDRIKVKRTTNATKPCMRFANSHFGARDPDKPSIARTVAEQSNFSFTMDTLPQMRIIFYQYCDVKVPRIQQMLEKIPTPMTGVTCSEKTGWLPPRFDEQCRDILTEIVLTNFRKAREVDSNTSEFEETEGDETEITFDDEDENESGEEESFDEKGISELE
ncbi:general transcription factor 3C polypeptide 5 [Topomyia yanbarensis]|uniref:general transcription factor 3C polypeptide 5 n=1 Tax=Topomyia yanbarensis TaxID=2498891 RepID=UPI00273BE7AB|nr:general transcription factor 3C polypeptide 5 [Topomyia yanbarensis]